MAPRPTLLRLFLSFLRLGGTSFGGPAMIAYIRKLAVDDERWIDAESFQDGVALCQTIPGAIAMQVAAYVGLKTRGVRGAAVCFLGFGLPACMLMLGLSMAYARSQALPGVVSVFSGLQAIIVAIVANATVMFGRTAIRGAAQALIALAATGLFLLRVSPVLIIAVAALLGVLARPGGTAGAPPVHGDHAPHKGWQMAVLLGATAASFLALFLFRRDLFRIAVLIAKVDLTAFGGGFAALPVMFHEIVEVQRWVDAPTFLNGIALGQVTPGPMVITATFVGYLTRGLAGALVASVAVFLPSFLLVVGLAPWFDRVRRAPWVAQALKGVLCSFVGLLFTVTLRFALEVHWDAPHILLAGAALGALLAKVDLAWVLIPAIAVSAWVF